MINTVARNHKNWENRIRSEDYRVPYVHLLLSNTSSETNLTKLNKCSVDELKPSHSGLRLYFLQKKT